MTTLLLYQEELIDKYCPRCAVDISTRRVRNYAHSGGYLVEGYEERQWLYVICGCKHKWSLQKLGVEEIT